MGPVFKTNRFVRLGTPFLVRLNKFRDDHKKIESLESVICMYHSLRRKMGHSTSNHPKKVQN